MTCKISKCVSRGGSASTSGGIFASAIFFARSHSTELTSEPATEYPAFAAPLMFVYALGRDRAIAALTQRAARIEVEISSSDAFRRAFADELPDFPRVFGIEEEYAQAMRRAELAWVRATVAELRDGTFPWPAPEDLPEYPAHGA